MDGDRLPPVLPPSAPAGGPPHSPPGDIRGAVVPLPPLPEPGSLPGGHLFSVPSPLLPARGHSAFLTTLTADELSTAAEEAPGPVRTDRPSPWRPPPAAYRVGSFIRNPRLCIHLSGCTKCREESRSMFRERSTSATGARGKSAQRQPGGRGRKRRSVSRGGRRRRTGLSAKSRSPGKKCSLLCVHPSNKARNRSNGRRSLSRKGHKSGTSPQSPSDGKAGTGDADIEFPLQHGSEIELPSGIKRLTVYHDRDFTQMTWEELMALLTTNFRRCAELSERQIQELLEIKTEILEKIDAGLIRVKDPRLKWKNRKLMLTLQLTHLSHARDIYRALWEALSEHNEHLRCLPTLLEVRAFREVHSFNGEFLASGCTLLRFTQVPGRLCGGINLYQACLVVVLGRRWLLRVLQRRLKRISDRTQDVNTVIDSVLQYKFQSLPADRMRVSLLLTKLDDLTHWFDGIKSQMLETVRSLHDDFETRLQRQLEETIESTMDAEVDGDGNWKHLYDFNRCLTGLVEDLETRNAFLRRMIDETRHSARRRAKDDREWHAWLLQERQNGGGIQEEQEQDQRQGGRLNISRTKWLPV